MWLREEPRSGPLDLAHARGRELDRDRPEGLLRRRSLIAPRSLTRSSRLSSSKPPPNAEFLQPRSWLLRGHTAIREVRGPDDSGRSTRPGPGASVIARPTAARSTGTMATGDRSAELTSPCRSSVTSSPMAGVVYPSGVISDPRNPGADVQSQTREVLDRIDDLLADADRIDSWLRRRRCTQAQRARLPEPR
jgi:enamine deaminase RidA (YjgF/YER057c/UK114 family)